MEKKETELGPPQGAVKAYEDLLKILENRSIQKVDKQFLIDHNIAPQNEGKITGGLKFLGLIDKEGNSTPDMALLNVVGEKRKENLGVIVKKAYSLLFDEIKLNLETSSSDDLVNLFKSDYQMGSPRTAKNAAQIFIFLAKKSGMHLSESIINEFTSDKTLTIKKAPQKDRPDKKRKKEVDKNHHDNMIKLEYGGEFILYLKDGDAKIREKVAKMAKQFIEAYEKDTNESN